MKRRLITIGDNSRHLRLARAALRAAVTHLRHAEDRVAMDAATREGTKALREKLGWSVDDVSGLERDANEYLTLVRRARKQRAA